MKKITLILTLIFQIYLCTANAAQSFVIQNIELEGLQRISTETVNTYLPIHPGETFRPSQSADVIKTLYQTGFFENISLDRRGNTLIIHLVERPTIGKLKVTGNSVIPTDKLLEVMKGVNIAEGRVYNQAVLDKIKLSLLNQYYQLGRYNARVDVNTFSMDRNRVLVDIIISEGVVAKVRTINIIGNKVFKQKDLNKQLTLSTPGLFTFFTQKDQYSQEKLDASLENIRNYYLDRGYLRATIKSSQAAITPDRKAIFVTIVIDEGEPYTISGIDLKGDLILPREELMEKVKIKEGSIFSRKAVLDTQKRISDTLGDKGYVFTEVAIEPKVNDSKHEIFLAFIIKPGKKAYVRHINFIDNAKTNDKVLRREIEQMESSVVSTSKLTQSKLRLNRLPYVKDVQMSVDHVNESDDQVDINYKVTEEGAATANFNIGYSQLDHLLLTAGLNQKNFLGTGNTLGLNFSNSRVQTFYGINFVNPYYTADGISRSLSFSSSRFDPKNANSSRSYTTNQLSFSDVYGIPIGQEQGVFNRLQLGYGYENTLIHLQHPNGSGRNSPSLQVADFVENHGRHFQQLDLLTGFSRDSRDRYIFPTKGMLHSIAANIYLPLTDRSLKYYLLDYNTKWYHPITNRFITVARGEVGYGSSFSGGAKNYPFFKNFYAGGIDSVRGYYGNILGPRDSNGYSTGGNLLVEGSLGLIFPNYISDNLRTTAFIDAGNVYDTFNNKDFGGTGSGSLRYSVGIAADWLTSLGMIDISLGKALNPRSGEAEFFQFSLGANFG